MKWAILTLLLSNLVLFVWHYQPPRNSDRIHRIDQTAQLVLLREYESQVQSAMDEKGVARCYSLGPFTRKDSFEQAKRVLVEQGVNVFSRISSEKVRKGYWVILPVAKTGNQARVQLQKLKEKGVKDYFLVATGDMKNAISLGVFSKPQLAKKRQESVEIQGFTVQVKQITLPKRTYWLEWPLHGEPQPDKIWLEQLTKKYDGIGQTARRCLDNK